MRLKWTCNVYQCNCGDCFLDREALVKHIANKRKGRYRKIHYAGDYVSGHGCGLKHPVYYLSDE